MKKTETGSSGVKKEGGQKQENKHTSRFRLPTISDTSPTLRY